MAAVGVLIIWVHDPLPAQWDRDWVTKMPTRYVSRSWSTGFFGLSPFLIISPNSGLTVPVPPASCRVFPPRD